MIAFGPVPSRRLGRSLGVNNIPAKHCSYGCLYCQVGPTWSPKIDRREFIPADAVVRAVRRKVAECRTAGLNIDFITFVPEGEPTLDRGLGVEIRALKDLRVPIAVITNGSLLWRSEVRADLSEADLVSVKIDCAEVGTWQRLNRPHDGLSFESVRRGIEEFAFEYRGELLTETMLVGGVNDHIGSIESVGAFLERLAPKCAYLAVPTRPPAERAVCPPSEESVVRANEFFKRTTSVELLVRSEEGEFDHTGDPLEDLCAILAVHPMKEPAVRRYLDEIELGEDSLEAMVRDGRIKRLVFQGEVFFVRRLGGIGKTTRALRPMPTRR